jgi:hypothetical protein
VPEAIASVALHDRTMESRVNYVGPMTERPRYHVNDVSRDTLTLDPRTIQIEDARRRAQPPSLEREGFALFQHNSAVRDFADVEEIARTCRSDTERLLLDLTHADKVVLAGPAVHRLAQSPPDAGRLTCSGRLYNTRPVCFVHIDISASTAAAFTERWRPKDNGRPVRRFAHYNVWRVLSPPPQDMPLALCDSRSVSASDLLEADAMMDIPGKRESSYTGLLVRYNPCHRWSYFPDMNRDEVLIFKTHDSDPRQPSHVPHSAFSDPTSSPEAQRRASIEMRGIAYWFAV